MTRTIYNVPLWVTALLILLTLLVEAPIIAFPFYAGDVYKGINIAPFGNDELYYLSRGKAVLEGHPLGQPFISGVGEVPDSFMSNVEYVYMAPLRALGLAPYIDVPTLYNILNTIGVFVLLLLIYLFVYMLSESALLAAAAAIFAIGGYYWVEYGTVIRLILTGSPIFQSAPNIFGRSTDPYTALIPFFGFLICTYRALMQEVSMFSFKNVWSFRFVIGAGVLFGVLFYDYFYAWTFALAVLGSLTLTALLWRGWIGALPSMVIGGTGVILGSYQMYGLYHLYTSNAGHQITYFLKSAYSHAPIQSTTGLAMLALFFVYWYLRRDDKNNFFILGIILAGWVALEQQVITGRVVEYGHYYWYFVVPLSIIVAIYMLVRLISVYSISWARFACILLIAGAFINTIGGQYKSFFVSVPEHLRQQDFAPIMARLQQLPEGVVLGDPGGQSTASLVTVYTKDTSYFNYIGVVNVFPMERYREALLVYLYLNRDSRSDPVAYLKNALHMTASTNYTAMYEDLEGYYADIPLQSYRAAFPRVDPLILAAREKFLPEIGEEYRSLARSQKHVRDMLWERGVRYILWDERQYPEWDASVLAPLTVLATSTDITLYSW